MTNVCVADCVMKLFSSNDRINIFMIFWKLFNLFLLHQFWKVCFFFYDDIIKTVRGSAVDLENRENEGGGVWLYLLCSNQVDCREFSILIEVLQCKHYLQMWSLKWQVLAVMKTEILNYFIFRSHLCSCFMELFLSL